MSDALVLSGRALRLSRRTTDALVTALVLPVLLMVLFVVLFGGALDTGTAYVQYVVPGVLLLSAGFGASTTAVAVSTDLAGGTVDRLRSLDVRGAALLTGHVTASVVRNLVSTFLVVLVALGLGFRSAAGPLAWLAAAGVLTAFVVTLSWLSAVLGLLARSAEAAGGFTFLVSFLPYPSSAFVPVATLPGWLQGFAAHQPVTPVIETLRGLLLGTPVGSYPVQALAWCAGLLVISVVLAEVLFTRRTSR